MKLLSYMMLLSMLLLTSVSYSQIVSIEEAESIAKKFVSAKYAKAESKELSLNNDYLLRYNDSQLYAFDVENGGFVIVSGEKSVPPILAYSNEFALPKSGENLAFDEWIDNYVDEINYCRAENKSADLDIASKWSDFSNETLNMEAKSIKGVSPLISSSWNQTGYYNDMCPTNESGEAVTGCIATAMAQIMYYYRFPTSGLGSQSYNAEDFGQQSVNFANATYDYSQMFRTLPFPSVEVAKINYHCGVSVKMSYGVEASGSVTFLAAFALSQNFKFSTNLGYKTKSEYSDNNWKSMLKSNIDDKYPIIYTGSSQESGGHAFICDGYDDEDYFHFNWGWGGTGDGYFYIGTLNPAGQDFSSSNDAIFNIYPPDNTYSGCSGLKEINLPSGTIEDGSGPIDDYAANCDCSWFINPNENCSRYSVSFDRMDIAEDDSLFIYKGSNSEGTLVAAFSGSTVPSSFIVSSDKFFINFKSNGANQANGFLISYIGTVPSSCSGITEMTEPSGTIDDGSGDEYYGNSSLCRWRINPAGATTITLDFLEFDIEERYDYVRIIDNNTSEIIADYSGDEIPGNVTIPSGNITVMFKTNANLCRQGFKLSYTSDAMSIDENNVYSSVHVFPNPTADVVNIDVEDGFGNATLSIVDFAGKIVYNVDFSGAETFSIPVGDLSKGVYFLNISSNNGNINRKLVID